MAVETTNVSGVSQLFQLLRDGVPRTRAEICELTGLARSTVAQYLDTLLASGLV
ncbi:MAG: transcriptional regulator, partial [Actinomycetota bacterium]|nr:transcriptional regulator [Actinomycetota bacterium]